MHALKLRRIPHLCRDLLILRLVLSKEKSLHLCFVMVGLLRLHLSLLLHLGRLLLHLLLLLLQCAMHCVHALLQRCRVSLGFGLLVLVLVLIVEYTPRPRLIVRNVTHPQRQCAVPVSPRHARTRAAHDYLRARRRPAVTDEAEKQHTPGGGEVCIGDTGELLHRSARLRASPRPAPTT